MNSIVELVAKQAQLHPDGLCIVDEKSAYTYLDTWKKVRHTAQVLTELNIRKKDCVIVECTQDFEFLVCNLSCELIGAIFVPIEYKSSLEKIRMISKETDAKLLIYETIFDLPLTKIEKKVFFERKAENTEKAFSYPSKEMTAEILYTTGTTGRSKGVEITNGNNIALAENIKYGTEMKRNNVELIPLPLSHSHGLRTFYANMLNGGAVVLCSGVSQVKRIFEWVDQYQISSMDLSPSAVLILIKLSKGKFFDLNEQLDYIEIGTAALEEDTKKLLMDGFSDVRLYNFYGSTESGRSSILDFSKERGRSRCIGKPAVNAEFVVTDEDRKIISSSSERLGLLASAGAMNMKGYWKQPELTNEIMQNGFIYSNDLGYIDKEGFIYIVGRKDDVINCGGLKIAPEEIEESVKKYEGILDCACVPIEDHITGQAPKIFIVVQEPEKFQKKEFIRFLGRFIDEKKMPKEIEIIAEIPRTYNGKIQRKKLLDRRSDSLWKMS